MRNEDQPSGEDDGSCSIGFMAYVPGLNLPLGLTAGHCLQALRGSDTYRVSEYNEQGGLDTIGSGLETVYQSKPAYRPDEPGTHYLGWGRDAGAFLLEEGFADLPAFPWVAVVDGSGYVRNEWYPILRVATARLSHAEIWNSFIVCSTMGHSGVTKCGTLLPGGSDFRKNVTFEGISGDSGSPVYKNGTAYGIYTGNRGIPLLSRHGIFQDARDAEQRLGIRILTVGRMGDAYGSFVPRCETGEMYVDGLGCLLIF